MTTPTAVQVEHAPGASVSVSRGDRALPPSHPDVRIRVAAALLPRTAFGIIAVVREHRLALCAEIPVDPQAAPRTDPGA
ncbi:hypothetical protein ACWGDT_12665 [Streptomyces avermitilis]